jgi:hypothetical protein
MPRLKLVSSEKAAPGRKPDHRFLASCAILSKPSEMERSVGFELSVLVGLESLYVVIVKYSSCCWPQASNTSTVYSPIANS